MVLLVAGLASAGYLWIRAELIRDGVVVGGPLADALNPYNSGELCLAAAVAAGIGLGAFILFGAMGQLLAILRDMAISGTLQVQLLEDILELNEAATAKPKPRRIELCEGCGRLGSLDRIESGQWVCRDCRRQLRTA